MRFDWYQATIPDDVRTVTRLLTRDLPGCTEARTVGRGGNGYLECTSFLNQRGGELGRMMSGGNQHPNFRASSDRAPAAATVVRRIWPRHRVTRMDVAIDFTGEGAFDHLHDLARGVVERSRLRSGLLFQPDLLDRGRTYRIGSPASPVMARLYEKGLHEGTRGRREDPNWTRLELQVRPQKAAKDAFASVSEREAWGASRWAARLLEEVTGSGVERIVVNPPNETEWERTQAALVKQYGRHALAGGQRLAGREANSADAIDAYIELLRRDLLDHVGKAGTETAVRALDAIDTTPPPGGGWNGHSQADGAYRAPDTARNSGGEHAKAA